MILWDSTKRFRFTLNQGEAKLFFEALTVCHTVEVLQEVGEKPQESQESVSERSHLMGRKIVDHYQASSPDEKAILEGCASLGLVYEGQNNDVLRICRYPSAEKLQFERLHVLEFSSERQRMSVILRDQSGTIWLYSKGAESAIFPRCRASPRVEQTDGQITKYAQKGLRTMAVARRTLTEEELANFEVLYRKANTQLSNRIALIAECYETVEIGKFTKPMCPICVSSYF